MHVVVFEERDAAAEARVGVPVDLLEHPLPASSAGCALPAKTIWTGRSQAEQQAARRSGSGKIRLPLVGGEAAGEADRERVGSSSVPAPTDLARR